MERNKGITLIALVITIIVLLILAAVSIATLTGENGILTQANKASYQTKLAELKENLQLDILDVVMGKGGNDLNKEELRKVFVKYFGEKNVPATNDPKWDNFPEGFKLTTENGKYTIDIAEIYDTNLGKMTAGTETTKPEGKNWKDTVTPVADGEGNIIPVPDGFSYKEGTKETGFVIQDGDGNEFVWVPCGEGGVTYERKNGLAETWKTAQEDGTAYKSKQYQYVDYNDWEDTGGDETSVDTYGGFYIGRYEAGIPTTGATFYTNGAGTYISEGRGNKEESTSVAELKPVSRKNHPSWNLITQKNALKVSSNMYSGNSAVTSSLIDSYAWDTVVEWIKTGEGAVSEVTNSKTYGNYCDANVNLPTDGLYALHVYYWQGSTGKGWCYANNYSVGKYTKAGDKQITLANLKTDYAAYDWSVAKSGWDFGTYTYRERLEIGTGAVEATKTKNIYDLAGNMWEWTTETGKHNNTDTEYAVIRGGGFADTSIVYPVCYRHGGCTASKADYSVNFGFRVVLYIQ